MSDETPGLSAWPERSDLYRESADEAVDIIIQNMADPAENDGGIDLAPHRASLTRCLSETREAYLAEYWDWLGRTDEEGGSHRPHRKESLNPGEPSPYDYGPFSAPDDAWRRHWDEFHAKPISATGNRSRKSGKFQGLANNGPLLGRPMLVGIYHRLYRWWNDVMPGVPFRSNFDGIEGVDDTATERFTNLNVPARLFALFAFEVDQRFTILHCARVAMEEERYQRASRAEAAVRKSERERRQRAGK